MKKLYLAALILCLPVIKLIGQPVGWNYTQSYTITNNTASLVTNYQAQLTLNTQALVGLGRMLSNGDDIRFGKNCAGTVLYNYWIESGMNTSSTTIWVKIDTLFPSATRTFYLFYGNNSATGVTAIPGVFNGPMSSTDSVASGGPGGVGNSQRGFRFSPNEDILVTAFGKDEPTGTTRYVTLFNFGTQAVISQQQVSGPAGQYSYQNIANPIWLTMGTQYVLELYQGASDGYYFGNSSQIGQQLTYYDMRYCNSCTQNTFPTNTLSNYHYGYPDLWYWTKNNVSPAPTVSSGSPPLALNAGSDLTYCIGGSGSIGAAATGGAGSYTYSWSPTNDLSATNTAVVTANPTVTTTYTLTATDACGTVVTDQVVVTVNPLPSIAATSPNDSICPGGNIDLFVTGSSSSYLWMPGNSTATTYNVSPSSTTTYSVTGTDANGCTNSTTLTITVEPTFSVVVTGSYTSICDNAITPLTLSATGASTYTWNPGNGTGATFTDTPSASTTYTVVGTDGLGCTAMTTYDVTVYPSPTIAAISNDTVCSGGTASVTGIVTGGTPAYTYLWTPFGNTTPSISFNPTSSSCFTLTVTDANGCATTQQACVVVNPLPVLTVTGSDSICNGGINTMVASGASTYTWNPGNLSGAVQILSPSTTTTYTITGTSGQGCVDSLMTTLTVLPLPTVTYTSSLDTVCVTDGAVTLTGGSPANGLYSGPGVSSGTFTPATAGNGAHVITYSFTDNFGCTGSATHSIVVDPCTGVNEIVNSGNISIYPNPFSTAFTVERKISSEATINLFDAEGRIVLTKKINGSKVEIETNGIANGIYTLQITDASGVNIFKLVKNN